MERTLRGTVFVGLFVVAAALKAQGPPPLPPPPPPGQMAPAGVQSAASNAVGTAFILGNVVDGSTGRAVGGVSLTLNLIAQQNPGADPLAAPATLSRFPARLITDNDGRFVFRDLPKGSYTVLASKGGYADGAFGRRTATDTGAQPIVVGDGQKIGPLSVPLWQYASIAGTVVDEAGEPVIGAQVRVLKRAYVGGRMRYTQFGNMPSTDDRGMYRVSTLTPGDYVVGMVMLQASVPLSLAQNQDASNFSSPLRRELDRSGNILRSSVTTGGQPVGGWILATPTSIVGGDPIAPPIDGGKIFVYPSIFYPASATLSKAAVMSLNSGDDRTGVDFQLRPVATSRVSGTLSGANGPEANTALELLPQGTEELQRDYDFTSATTVTDGSGGFTFLGVAPGNYTLRALKIPPRPVTTMPANMTVIQVGNSTITSTSGPSTPPPIPPEPTYWTSMSVAVGASDVSGLSVSLRTGARVTGHLEFDGAAQKPAADRLVQASVTLDSADGRTTSSNSFTLTRGVVDATGQFKTYQLPAGKYLVRASGALPGWTFKSASLNGRDISDAPFDLGSEDIADVIVTFTDKPTELSGTARDTKGPDTLATVVLFPSDPASWLNQGQTPRRLKTARTGTDGSYRFTSLPPGEYLVAAVHSTLPGEWMDPQFLQKLAALATRITISDREKSARDLESQEVR
jgi:protocatechuate 3,4-dioxygenase beta subunit